MDSLVNKVALVTGANCGIGRALVLELVKRGLKVVGIDRNIDQVKILVDELKSAPGKLYPIQADLANQNEIIRCVEWTEKNLGGIDILVNSSGILLNATILEGGIEEWRKTLDINVLGLTLMTKEVLQLMKKRGIDNGMIVNINDILGLKIPLMNKRPLVPPYIVSKQCLTTISELLRLELAQIQSNIKVINICPGLTETETSLPMLKEKQLLALKPEDVVQAVMFTLQTPENVLIQDLVITPIRETTINSLLEYRIH